MKGSSEYIKFTEHIYLNIGVSSNIKYISWFNSNNDRTNCIQCFESYFSSYSGSSNIKCPKENISNISASTYSIGSYNGGSSKILNVQFEVILIG